MSKLVLDASAILAVIHRERGAESLSAEQLLTSAASTVNLAEVQTKLVSRGLPEDQAWQLALAPVSQSVDFTAAQARLAGRLVAETRMLGLSLGDRACLALGITLQVPIYTADRAWKRLRLGIPIHTLR